MCVFCVRIRMAFARVVWLFVSVKRLLHTYMALCTLSGFYVLILSFDSFNVSVIRSWGLVNFFHVPIIQSWGFVDWFDVSIIRSWGFIYSFDVRANARDDLTDWRICPEDLTFRIIWPTICTFWLDRLEDPSSGFCQDLYPALFTWFTVQLFPQTVSCWSCRAIYKPV